MRVRWYLNDGTAVNGYGSPGTLEFDSNWNTITATAGSTLKFTTPPDFPTAAPGGTNGLFIPSRQLTVTVQFQGLGAGDTAGLELFGPVPTTGDQFADYWLKTVSSSTWQLLQDTNGVQVTFGEEWMGTPVPEPSTLAISLVGGVGLFLAVRRFRK